MDLSLKPEISFLKIELLFAVCIDDSEIFLRAPMILGLLPVYSFLKVNRFITQMMKQFIAFEDMNDS